MIGEEGWSVMLMSMDALGQTDPAPVEAVDATRSVSRD